MKFVDSIDKKRHIALLYEDSEYARLLESRFLKSGLERGEQCLYVTCEDSGLILLKLLRYGIPLEYFQTCKIRVLQLEVTDGHYDTLKSRCKKEILRIIGHSHTPVRLVGRFVPKVDIITGMSIELEFEDELHKIFDDLGGSIMCPYELGKLEPTMKTKWISGLVASHHDVIYASKFGEGEVLSVT